MRATTADTLARFGDGSPAPGGPALTAHAVGRGRALYVAAVMDQGFYDDLMAALLGGRACPVRPRADGARVEVVPARTEAGNVYVVLNHDATPRAVEVSGPCADALTGAAVDGSLELAGYDVAILRPT